MDYQIIILLVAMNSYHEGGGSGACCEKKKQGAHTYPRVATVAASILVKLEFRVVDASSRHVLGVASLSLFFSLFFPFSSPQSAQSG